MIPITISQQTARRFVLGKQGLWPGRRWTGKRSTAQAIRTCEAVQLDPLIVIARSQDIVLHSRILDYKPEYLYKVAYEDREFFDYGGWLAMYPMSELPYWRVHMEKRSHDKHIEGFVLKHEALFEQVRAELRRRGPLGNRDFNGNKVGAGEPLIQSLFEKRVKKVIGTDINPDHINSAKKKFAGKNLECRLVEKGDLSIFSEECDISSPNATGAILNQKTIPMLKVKIVCGAANNQLEDMPSDGRSIHDKGIIYVPDFLTNRMGIVTCANEQYGYINNDPMIENHFSRNWEHSIFNRAMQVLEESKEKNIPSAEIALKLADKLSRENHPIFGHRGKEIIESLVENIWHLG